MPRLRHVRAQGKPAGGIAKPREGRLPPSRSLFHEFGSVIVLTPEQRARYARIQEGFEARLRELGEAGHAGFADAEEQTKR